MNRIDFACHFIAIVLLVGFSVLFGLMICAAWGGTIGSIAGGLLAASMVSRYIANNLERGNSLGGDPK